MGGTLPCVHHVGNGLLRPCPNSAPFTLPQCQVLTISNAPGFPRWLSKKRESQKKKKEEERICLPTQETQETGIRLLGWEDPLEEGMATPSSILAWKVPWKRSLVGHSPWGGEESDTTEHTYTPNAPGHSALRVVCLPSAGSVLGVGSHLFL